MNVNEPDRVAAVRASPRSICNEHPRQPRRREDRRRHRRVRALPAHLVDFATGVGIGLILVLFVSAVIG